MLPYTCCIKFYQQPYNPRVVPSFLESYRSVTISYRTANNRWRKRKIRKFSFYIRTLILNEIIKLQFTEIGIQFFPRSLEYWERLKMNWHLRSCRGLYVELQLCLSYIPESRNLFYFYYGGKTCKVSSMGFPHCIFKGSRGKWVIWET